jgi:hypothetical protein
MNLTGVFLYAVKQSNGMMKISSYHMKTSKYLNVLLTIIKQSAVIKKEKIKLHLVREKYTSR